MKKKYLILPALLAFCAGLVSCSNDEPFSTASPDDVPRILDPIFPDRQNGDLAVFSTINRDANLNIALTVTPADYCTVSWLLDGTEVHTGIEIDMNLKAGTYSLKILVTTDSGKSTSREGIVKVNPLEGDPVAETRNVERIVVPGGKAVLYGSSLDKVDRLIIGGKVVDDVVFDTDHITYTVPADVEDGVYRVVLVGEDNVEYGGDRITVSSVPLVVSMADRSSPGSSWTMTGINLDEVVSLKLGESVISSFSIKTPTEITFVCPEVEPADYVLTGEISNGGVLYFYTADGNMTERNVTVSSETVLWTGHHYVSWELEDGDPNKTFSFITKETFASLQAGSTLLIQYSLEPSAATHQMQVTTVWWTDLPGTGKIDLTADGTREVVLTQEALDLIQTQDGFLIVGHGFFVDCVSVK